MRARRRITPGTAGAWLLLALLPLLSHRGAAQVAPTTTLTFNSAADTYVDGGSATTNFNSAAILRADASPARTIYLRFAVTGVGGRQVQQARLRLGVNAGSPAGGTVHLITNTTWNEATVTYNTRPALDGPGLQTLGAVTAGATIEFALDGAIAGDGVYNLAIDSTNSAAVAYNSSLAPSGQKPQLALTVAAQAPTVTIVQPPTGASYFTGDAITLQASAHDSAGVDLGTHVVWSSNLAGTLGTGAVVTTSLAQGTHTITATVQVVTGVALEFPAVADASVDAGLPTANFGTSPTLAVDANLVRNTYLRFDVSGLATRTILGAVLRLQVDATAGAESGSGGVLHTITDGSWQENAVTFNNRPAVDGPTIASQGPVRLGQTVEFDVAAAVTADGTYDFAIVNGS